MKIFNHQETQKFKVNLKIHNQNLLNKINHLVKVQISKAERNFQDQQAKLSKEY